MLKIVKKIRNKLGKGFAFFYIWCIAKTRTKQNISNNKIAVIFNGHIGDAILGHQALNALADYYVSIGKDVYLLCEKSLWDVLRLCEPKPKVSFIDLSGLNTPDKGFSEIKRLSDSVKKLEFEKSIVIPNRNLPTHYIAACISDNEKWGFLDITMPTALNLRIKQKVLYKFYTDYVTVSPDIPYTESIRDVLMKLGVPYYKTKISYLPKQGECKFMDRKKYITVAVDSMATARRWCAEYFIDLIQRLINSYSYDIVLTGRTVPTSDNEKYRAAFASCSKVKNLIGKTGFMEFIELIRGAEFHIGIDSGSIHVAASVGTQAFCLTGVWDGNRLFPYRVEEPADNTADPICIYRKDTDIDQLFCRNCTACRGGYGINNQECYMLCKSGRPCLCLSKITPDDVMAAINHAREAGVIQ
ncbi:glycosyltransferase family 9 protein [uncultured Dysosmobacter sp.]|uniref:glycosyltransferase family 9 protein n=1 Tax=uncultured Dysosmobacter sp. TaxID=2591384 RepID=UPI002631FF6F|nr:glycosyltransferase family 9 protein [uncultured Dysosmobacter sp.]